jgi:oligopeptide transport system substrate-binding protein
VKARPAALAALLAAVATAAGCSRGGSNVASGDASQVLHRSIGVDVADLDPQLATQASDYSVLSALFEGLLGEDPVDLHPVPGVAESWEVSDDGLAYTFHIRSSARWSDGNPVTAGDFIASWRRILTPELGATTAEQLYLIRGAEAFNRTGGSFSEVGLAAPDPRTLRVALDHPAPWFLSVLSSPAWLPVPIETVTRLGSPTRRGNPWAAPGTWVGNGPFNLVSWRHGQVIVVGKSPTYWDAARIRLREIHFHAFDSLDTEERAFRTGQIHVTDALPLSRIEAYRRENPRLMRIDPLLATFFLRINTRRPGLDDPRVRLALALSVDRQAIVERILRGNQTPAYSFTPPGLQEYSPEPVQRRDPDRARRLLEEAGHPGGRGLPRFHLLYNSSEANREVVEALQEMWRRIGAYDLMRSSWIADYVDPSAFLEMWKGDSGNNFTGWSSPDFDALMEGAGREMKRREEPGTGAHPSSRLDDLRQAETLLLREAPIIPLYHYTHVFLIRPSVHGWYPTLLDHHPYKGVWLEP